MEQDLLMQLVVEMGMNRKKSSRSVSLGGGLAARDQHECHAIAILDATVRSLSSLALFFSNACCLQLSKF